MNTIPITWLGHSCFLLEYDGYRIVIDPYDDSVPGYAPLHVDAHMVLTSHDHFDHNYTPAVSVLPEKENPFTIRTVDSFHDDCGGTQRGKNLIHVLSAGGLTVAHLGDLGGMPTQELKDQIGPCDAILIPVGGFYTMDFRVAKETADFLGAKVVIPMHYRSDTFGFDVIETVAPFLAQYPAEMVKTYATNTLALTKDTPAQVAVLTYQQP